MRKIKYGWLIFLLTFVYPLQSEIEQIEIKWNAFKCMNVCVPLIENSLKSIKGVTTIQSNPRSGSAVVGWDSNYPFNFEPFKLASASAGIHFDEILLRVRGTVSHDQDNFYLISQGDGTRFMLIGTVQQEPGRYVPRHNISTRPLSEEVKQQLLGVERVGLLIIISGPLFQPFQNPLTLIVKQIQLTDRANR